jgi:hypothetical protein
MLNKELFFVIDDCAYRTARAGPRFFTAENLVRTAGFEPARDFSQGILSPLRLPFRHVRNKVRARTFYHR